MLTIETQPCILSHINRGGYMYMEKVCTGCKVLKNFDEFGNYKKAFDGKNQKCKQCCRERSKLTIHSQEAIAKKNAYKAGWQRRKAPILNARRREDHANNLEKYREACKIRTRRYLQTEHGKKKHIETTCDYERKNPEKIKAQRKVRAVVKSGRLIKPENCEICKKKGNIGGHHEDYTKPLEVIWMCSVCHLYHHQRSRFYADRLSEKTPKGDATVRSCEETARGEVEELSPPSKDGQ